MSASTQAPLNIATDHPAYPGHFPAFPVLPGAVLIDAALAVIEDARRIDITQFRLKAKFSSAVRPGESLHIEHEVSDSGAIAFRIGSAGRIVASGSLTPRVQPA